MKYDFKNVDDIVENLEKKYQELENTLRLLTMYYLIKCAKNKKIINLLGFKKKINTVIIRENKKITKMITNAEKVVGVSTKKILKTNNKAISKINNIIFNDVKKFDYRKTDTDVLYNSIKEYTEKGIETGYRVVYSNGSTRSFKSYMEMNVRTTLRFEINNDLSKKAKENGIFCWICDSYTDCADDHVDYQGKMYISRDWQSMCNEEDIEKIQNFIDSNNILFKEDVENSKPYLTIRPNCRHILSPITLEQFLGGNIDKTLKEVGGNNGTYKDGEYEKMQKQRYYERELRNTKTSIKINDALGIDNSQKENRIKELNKKINELGRKRDSRREENNVILNDLGAKYHKK